MWDRIKKKSRGATDIPISRAWPDLAILDGITTLSGNLPAVAGRRNSLWSRWSVARGTVQLHGIVELPLSPKPASVACYSAAMPTASSTTAALF